MALLLLEVRERLPVLGETSVEAGLLDLLESAESLEVDADVGAELVLSDDGGIGGPVLVVCLEGT